MSFQEGSWAQDGGVCWKFTTGGRVVGPPTVVRGNAVCFVSEDRYLYLLAEGGDLLKRVDLGFRPATEAVTGADGSIYVIGRTGTLKAFNPAGGFLWSADIGGPPAGPPVTGRDGTIFTCSENGIISAWSHHGMPRWRGSIGQVVSAPPALSGDSFILIPCENGYLHAFDRYGRHCWSFLTAGKPARPFPAFGTTACGTAYGTVFLLDGNGTLLWNRSYDRSVRILSKTAERIYISLGESDLRCLSAEGAELWRRGFQGRIEGLYADSEELMVLGAMGMEFLSYQGTWTASIPWDGGNGDWHIGTGGRVYWGGENWNAAAFYVPRLESWTDQGVDGTAGYEVSPDYLDSTDYRYLLSIATGENAALMEGVLEEYERSASGSPPAFQAPYAEEILRVLAAGAVTQPIYREKKIINDFPLIRARAIRLLGRYGTLATINFLLSLLSLEWDPFVTAGIIETLGLLGSDASGLVGDRISAVMERGGIDERIAGATIGALERMIVYNGTVTSESAVLLCLAIFRGNYSRDLKSRASRIIMEAGK